MRYYNYLNENLYTIDEINELIKKDCKYYLSLINHGAIFTRALGNPIDFPFIKKQTRQDRMPSGMPVKIFKKFNQWLKMNGHTTRDNSVIGTSHDTLQRTAFGNNYFLFPIGKFNFTYAETEDINMDDRRTGWEDDIVDRFLEDEDVDLSKPFEHYFHTNKKIHHAYDLKYEIWFDCKEYYLAALSYYKWDKKSHRLYMR